jgi:hypothetical protein
MSTEESRKKEIVIALSSLAMSPRNCVQAVEYVRKLDQEGRAQFLDLADGHHVVLRAIEPLQKVAAEMGHADMAGWASEVIEHEHKRINNALRFLAAICQELEVAGCETTVMKSLDHWPDLGNDLDLYTSCPPDKVKRVFLNRLGAKMNQRTWGDHLANKWNFSLPGLREQVEVHSRRLGQTGEHIALAARFHSRRVPRQVSDYSFYVPAPEERVIAATLQRMYRHFFFRICDVMNTAALIRSGSLDFVELRSAAELGSVWPGVATFLRLVSEYFALYSSSPIDLPAEVFSAARFGIEKVEVKGRGFLRIPLASQVLKLYALQMARMMLRGNLLSAFRLSLLGPLASAAALRYALTGDEHGIW